MTIFGEPYEYDIAKHYLSAIVNGDYSGLDASDADLLNTFLDDTPQGCWEFPEEEQYGNFKRCDVCGLMADCVNATLYPYNKP